VLISVTVMHEQVHERTSGEEQPRQRTEHMSRMLSDQEEPGDDQKTRADHPSLAAPESCGCAFAHDVAPD
jgi:hypothetical protein